MEQIVSTVELGSSKASSLSGVQSAQIEAGKEQSLHQTTDLKSVLDFRADSVPEKAPPPMDWVDGIDRSLRKRIEQISQAGKSPSLAHLLEYSVRSSSEEIIVNQISKSATSMRDMINRLLNS